MASNKRIRLEEESPIDFDLTRRLGVHNAFATSGYKEARLQHANTQEGPLFFTVESQPGTFTDPSSLELLCRMTLYEVTSTGTKSKVNVKAADPDTYRGLGIPNHFAHLLWNEFRVTMGSNNLVSVDRLYHIISWIETLIGTSGNTKLVSMSGRGYVWETGTDLRTPNTDGYLDRRQFWAPNHAVDVAIPLHLDLTTMQGKLAPGMPLHVEVKRNPDSLCLFQTDDKNYKIWVEDPRLRVKQYTLADTLRLNRNNMLNERWYLPYTRTEVRDFAIGEDDTLVTKDDLWSGNAPLPERVIMVMLKEKAILGDKSTHPLKFESTGFENAWLTKSGPNEVDIPFSPVDLKNGSFGLNTCYEQFLKAIGITPEDDRDIGITVSDYLESYFMVAWDLTSDLCARTHFMHKPKYGLMGLRIKLSANQQQGANAREAMRAIVYSVYPEVLKIDEDGRCSQMVFTQDKELN